MLMSSATIITKIVTFLFLLFTVVIYPASAQPISSRSSELEAQVLQIIRKHPEIILESIEEYRQSQQEQERQEQERQVQLELLQAIKVDPEDTVGKSPIKGRVDSKVLLIEFSDFQCPYCAEAHETLNQFVVDHQDKVALVYKHYPIAQIHSEAMSAAAASWAAHQQNKFWQYHDFLFTHQNQIGESLYLQAAKDLGLNLDQFERDCKSQDAATAIQKDMELAEKLGISGTPFFVMNEETFSGAVQGSFLEDRLAKM
jgi:protein-disulfide isomerase